MAKGIIRGDEEPGVAAGLDDRGAGAVRQCHRVVGPVHRGRRARLTGQVRGRGARDQENLVLIACDLLDGERYARSRHVDNRVDAVIAEPLGGDRRTDIRLVLVVGADELDFLAVDAAAKIGDRHSRRLDRPRPANVRVEPGHVIENADPDDVAGDLGRSRRTEGQGGGNGENDSDLDVHSLCLHVKVVITGLDPVIHAFLARPSSRRRKA
jgi:hypothetical protein